MDSNLVIAFTDVPEKIEQSIVQGLMTCWPQHADRFIAEGKILNGNYPMYTFVMMHDDVVIAHCGLVEKEVEFTKTPYCVAGLQQTFVLPKYRGQNLTKILLDEFVRVARKHNFDFAMGFARDYVWKFHLNAGWSALDDYINEQRPVYKLIALSELPAGSLQLNGKPW